MDDKKQKSIDTISKRIDKLEVDIEVPLDMNYMTILLKGQSPQYNVRFAAWARDTLDKGDHMENLVQAMLSHFAIEALTTGGDEPRMKANGILFLYEEMQRLSNANEFISDKENT